ncbi:hypothetical protein [Brevundimonas naejangsanensis]|uniref:hypothetical protein n=1 Tax=Brevundimonas naejangsanensis TaxID=588932 RepID=UPI0026ECE335|nr:hypothetical protein [Brevundimonas naejangsanensis]
MTRASQKPASPAELSAIADRVEALLKAALVLITDKDPYSSAAWRQRDAAMAGLKVVLETTLQARINQAHDVCRIRIAGVSTSCTAGLEGAVRNWIAAARRKAAA